MQGTKREEVQPAARRIRIDFLYLDLEVCDRCLGTNANLDSALAEVSSLLAMTGVAVSVEKILVESEAQAKALGFVSSPTLRVNGKDIALEFRESRCESCESCACNGTVNCRVWVYQGREYTEAPKAMIIEAILREVYGRMPLPEPPAPPKEVPENLRRFFSGKAEKARSEAGTEGSPCCPPARQADCCEPLEKAVCCPTSEPDCDCQ